MGLAKDEKRARLSAFLSQLPPKTSLKFAEASGLFDVLKSETTDAAIGVGNANLDKHVAETAWSALCERHQLEAARLVQVWTEAAVGLDAGGAEAPLDDLLAVVRPEIFAADLEARGVAPEAAALSSDAVRAASLLKRLNSCLAALNKGRNEKAADALRSAELGDKVAIIVLAALATNSALGLMRRRYGAAPAGL